MRSFFSFKVLYQYARSTISINASADQMIHSHRQLLTHSKAHVDLSDSLKGPKISFKQGLMDSC